MTIFSYISTFYQRASFLEGVLVGLLVFLVMFAISCFPHKDEGPW